ncbi:MAG: hypothetical protein R3E79_33285 [Caldilineaceae bacterium]
MNLMLSSLIGHGLLYGALLSTILSIMILWSLWLNPEIWVHDAPREIQEKYGPISKKSKRQRTLFVIPFFLMVIALPWLALYQLPLATGQPYTFQSVFTTLFVMFMLFNIVDLLVIDWLIVEAWRPDFICNNRLGRLMEGRYYKFHFLGFCKGSVGLTLVSLLVAGGVAALT